MHEQLHHVVLLLLAFLLALVVAFSAYFHELVSWKGKGFNKNAERLTQYLQIYPLQCFSALPTNFSHLCRGASDDEIL